MKNIHFLPSLILILILLGIINYKALLIVLGVLTILGFILWIFTGGSKPKINKK